MDNENEEVKSESQEVNDVPAETAGSTEAAQSEETVATEEQGNVAEADPEQVPQSEESVKTEAVEETDAAAAGEGEE